MLDYRYMLIRYIPDVERMEPVNVGVILQGQGLLEVRLSPHAAKRKDIDTLAFRQWKEFFLQEVQGESVPLFQPEKTSPRFLHYLAELCDGPINVSRPLSISTSEERTFAEVLESLFTRLVLPPELDSPVENLRPTGRFRKLTSERKFLQRGMKAYVHVPVQAPQRWMAYRQVLNGEFIAIDKVEAGRELGRTATEIDKLLLVSTLVDQFMNSKIEGKSTRYVLLADELKEPFSEQSGDEFKAMRDDLENVAERIRKLGGQVLRSSGDAEKFAGELDLKLPQPC